MGKIRTGAVKRLSRQLLAEYGPHFTNNFDENKLILQQVVDLKTKRYRNLVAGYITRLVRQREALYEPPQGQQG